MPAFSELTAQQILVNPKFDVRLARDIIDLKDFIMPLDRIVNKINNSDALQNTR